MSSTLPSTRSNKHKLSNPSAAKSNQDSDTDLDDMEMKMEEDSESNQQTSIKTSARAGSARSTLKQVAIPSPNVKLSARRDKRIILSRSPSPSISTLSSMHNHSSEYETPGTSIAVTPAESLSTISKNTSISKAMDGTSKGYLQRKRKYEEPDSDTLLAQMLQEEEYQEMKPVKSVFKRRQTVVKNGSDDDDEVDFTDFMKKEDYILSLQPSKKLKANTRLSLPTRVARDIAQKSITEKSSHDIIDTDSSESELSEYMSDEDLEDPDDSEVAEDDALENTAMVNTADATANVTSNARSNLSAAQRRRRSAPAAVTNRYIRRDWRDRVNHRVRLFTCFLKQHLLTPLRRNLNEAS